MFSLLNLLIGGAVIVVGVVVYMLHKAGKTVTVKSVEAGVETVVNTVKTDVTNVVDTVKKDL